MTEKDEKYSLRQRQRRSTTASRAKEQGDAIPAAVTKTTSGRPAKEKKKPKAPPLSKYRRKTANARERTRMREINSAFENLRKCVPASISCDTPTSTNEKLTKITTLRLAMKYIRTLNDVLNSPYTADTELLLQEMIISKINDQNSMTIGSGQNYNDNNNSIVHNFNSYSAPIELNNNDKAPRKRSPKKAATTKIPATKKRTHRTATTAATKTTKSKRNAKKTNGENQCMLMTMDALPPAVDLGLMLESDGESLHLSEPCLSPLAQTMKPFNCPLTTSGSLDLGMFLESDNDSLEFSEPCLSPLGAFDALSPFGDLLHSGFTEQSSLDIYLT